MYPVFQWFQFSPKICWLGWGEGRKSYLDQLPTCSTVTVKPIFSEINLVIILIIPNTACLQKLNKEVVIGGVSYKTSSNKLTKTRASSTKKQSGRGMKSLATSKIGKLLLTCYCSIRCQKSAKSQPSQQLTLHNREDHYCLVLWKQDFHAEWNQGLQFCFFLFVPISCKLASSWRSVSCGPCFALCSN